MIRQDIRIANYTNKGEEFSSYKYIVDFLKHGKDFKDDIRKKYSMCRKSRIINDITYDTDVYIIETSLIGSSNIAFPMTNGSFVGFSNDPSGYCEDYSERTFKVGGDDITPILVYDENEGMVEANVPCDKIRIYHPHTKVTLDAIIYVDTVVRDTHFHLLCRPYDTYITDAETDFSEDHELYSEFIECDIPSMEWLMSGEAYYNELVTVISITGNDHGQHLVYTPSDGENIDDVYVSLKLYQYPFRLLDTSNEPTPLVTENKDNFITEDEILNDITKSGKTIYTSERSVNADNEGLESFASERNTSVTKSTANEYVTYIVTDGNHSVGIIKDYRLDDIAGLDQYSVADGIRVTLAPYTYIDSSTHIYINDSGLEMNSDIFQESNAVRLVAEAVHDDTGVISILTKFIIPDRKEGETVAEAYERHYGVDLTDYVGIVEYPDDEDIDSDDYVEQKQCGFFLDVFTDYKLQQKAGQLVFDINDPKTQLDDFSIQIDDILNSWAQMPETLIIQTTFIDRWTGMVIKSEPLWIEEETVKYMVNDAKVNPIVNWTNNQTIIETNDEMDKSKINFIDTIRCTIKKTEDSKDAINGTKGGVKTIYRPIFYRAHELQNIVIYTNVVQNVGIALADYMTKVESFKLIIQGQQIIEKGRNDIYVIFQVDGSGMNEGTVTYHITNQDDELVSTGTAIIHT